MPKARSTHKPLSLRKINEALKTNMLLYRVQQAVALQQRLNSELASLQATLRSGDEYFDDLESLIAQMAEEFPLAVDIDARIVRRRFAGLM